MNAFCKGVLSLSVLLLVFGCGGGAEIPDIGHVEGTVTMDSKPLVDAIVTFQPKGARPSYARTDKNGEYELVYTTGNYGAVLGEHRVLISTLEEANEDDGIKAKKERVPAKYNVDTELTETVKAEDNTFDFKLDSAGEIADPGGCGTETGDCCGA